MQQNKKSRRKLLMDEHISAASEPHCLRTDTLLQLQGECKIKQIVFLKFNIIKAIILTLLATVSVVGLFMLVWFRWFRVRIWFSRAQFYEANYLYIFGSDDQQIQKIILRQQSFIYFFFHKLKYRMSGTQHVPVAYNYQQIVEQILSDQLLLSGLNTESVQEQRKQFGYNQHLIQIPNYFAYMLDILLKPFFLIQYLVCLSYFLQGFFQFGILNLIFSIITTTINYILTYISYKKIKQMAEKVADVRVFRNGHFVTVKSNMLVPGDLIDPTGQIMCDCILIKGDIYVNEASLTGQNIPIAKFPVGNLQQIEQKNRWLFEGSNVVDKRGNLVALVVYTGYLTRRGRIIRKILTKKPKPSQIFNSALNFLLLAFLVSMVIYVSTIAFHKARNVSDLVVVFRFVDFLGWAFPPTFPIFFNSAYSYTLIRLKNNDILCTEPEKTVQASNMKIMCFDKTGTLTQNTVEVYKVFKFIHEQDSILDITSQIYDKTNQLIVKLFATCHTTIKLQQEFLGDQIDVRMFLFSQYQFQNANKQDIKFQVINRNTNNTLQVIRINQFQSKFQSMSVLVRDRSNQKIYVFIKGAPQRIQNNLQSKTLDKMVKSLSLGGYRTIAFGYRQIPPKELNKYLQAQRDLYENQITLLGLVAFNNKVKEDSKQAISRLIYSGIQPKIITGDNIYIAIQTGVRTGIISSQDKIIIIEGKKQSIQPTIQQGKRIFKGVLLSRIGNQINQQLIKFIDGEDIQNFPIVVDNSFLKLTPTPILTSNMKLYARISPENKAFIVTKLKQKLTEQHQNKNKNKAKIQKLLGQFRPKVGMCGDGANDLMAIRSADVGIGIENSDARYAAMFSINKLLDVEYIVRDSKATVTNIVEMILYYEFMSFLKIPASLLILMDTSNFNDAQIMFYSFAQTMLFPIFMPISKPSKIITKQIPRGNLFGMLNQLQFWGSLVISTACLTCCFLYFYYDQAFIPNPEPKVIDSWYPRTHSATCMFLLIIFLFAVYPMIFYTGYPWKQPIYKNYLLTGVIVLNILAAIGFYYFNDKLEDVFSFVPIAYRMASVMLAIQIATALISLCYNKIIARLFNGNNYIVYKPQNQYHSAQFQAE